MAILGCTRPCHASINYNTYRMEARRSLSTMIFVLLMLWINLRSIEPPSEAVEEKGFFSAINALNRTIRPTNYPSNVSDWYKGTRTDSFHPRVASQI